MQSFLSMEWLSWHTIYQCWFLRFRLWISFLDASDYGGWGTTYLEKSLKSINQIDTMM